MTYNGNDYDCRSTEGHSYPLQCHATPVNVHSHYDLVHDNDFTTIVGGAIHTRYDPSSSTQRHVSEHFETKHKRTVSSFCSLYEVLVNNLRIEGILVSNCCYS